MNDVGPIIVQSFNVQKLSVLSEYNLLIYGRCQCYDIIIF